MLSSTDKDRAIPDKRILWLERSIILNILTIATLHLSKFTQSLLQQNYYEWKSIIVEYNPLTNVTFQKCKGQCFHGWIES